ncbi:MAG TPA: PIN domain-containing protein [Polyangiaceae bacterium]|jgi:tRNA(fMet)-specific endonuclease VapC|nr:PIN domain-containing protein [Polyangiaceae bacterium]
MNDRKFMLDTDTVSFALRGQGDVGERLTAHAPSEVCLSAISLSELRFGADKRRSKRLHRLIDTFTATVDVLPFDSVAATIFGRVCAALQVKGTPIGTLDTLIAAHAMSLNLTLVTNNAKHFKQVRGLKTQSWLHGAG